MTALSLASQSYRARSTSPRRSRLAGEEARKPCTALAAVFAGKPAPAVAFAWGAPWRRSTQPRASLRKPGAM
ncbi:MAG: hypothetical protein DI621_23930 [Pseudomonas protegens]|nr:hypothetical protein C1883_14565 [Pseudomonas protegens]PZP04685.1 MAG: hypothetical protein DI621_23930 [Pseudomonas protegens]